MTPPPARRRAAAAADEDRAIRSGLMASGGVHLVFVLAALFGGQLFRGDEAQAVRIADVDLVSGAAFEAMLSSAPEGPRGPAIPPAAPSDAAEPPDPTRAPVVPSPPSEAPESLEAPKTGVAVDAPVITAPAPLARPSAPDAPDATAGPARGVAAVGLPLPAGPDRPDAPQSDRPVPLESAPPRAADRVAPTPAPPSEAITEAETPTLASRPDPSDTSRPAAPQPPAAAPREATSQIVTEADESSEEIALAPVASAIPVGRPEAPPAAPAGDAPPEPIVAAEASDTPPETPADPQPSSPAASASQPTAAPLGPALTSGQVEGVKLGIQKYWRMDRVQSLPNFEDLVVVLRAELDGSGKIVGRPEVVTPRGDVDGRWKIAISTATIALQRAGRDGFELPADSYGRWKVIEITFNPGRGVSM